MPWFKYDGYKDETRVKGEISANTLEELKDSLKNQGIRIIRIERTFKIKNDKIKDKQKLQVFQMIKSLSDAGFVSAMALQYTKDTTDDKKLKKVLEKIFAEHEQGTPMSQAFSANGFGEDIRSSLYNGEATSNMSKAYANIERTLGAKIALSSKLKGAATYPAAILIVALLAVVVMMLVVIPKFQKIFEDLGKELPAITMMLVRVSEWFRQYYWIIPIVIITIFVGIKYLLSNEKNRYWLNTMILKIPVISKLIILTQTSALCNSLITAISAGLTMMDGLRSAANTPNIVFRKELVGYLESLGSGNTQQLSEHLKNSKLFSRLTYQFVAIAEQGSRWEETLSKYDKNLNENIDKTVGQITKMAEPAAMMIIGGIVGFVIIAMFMPILTLGAGM